MSGNAKRRPGGNRAASEAFEGAAPETTAQDPLPLDDPLDAPDYDDGRAVRTSWFTTPEGEAVEAIMTNGERILWWLAADVDGAPENYAPITPPAHEKVGRLPHDVHLRLGFQCTGTTKAGRRCRASAPTMGGTCYVHRNKGGAA